MVIRSQPGYGHCDAGLLQALRLIVTLLVEPLVNHPVLELMGPRPGQHLLISARSVPWGINKSLNLSPIEEFPQGGEPLTNPSRPCHLNINFAITENAGKPQAFLKTEQRKCKI